MVWIGLAAQAEVLDHVDAAGPWEVSLAFYKTKDAHLCDLGIGWQEPYRSLEWDLHPCEDRDVLITRELDTFPTDPDELRALAFDLGARIEDAWGFRQRRFLDGQGQFEGQFNPGRWRI